MPWNENPQYVDPAQFTQNQQCTSSTGNTFELMNVLVHNLQYLRNRGGV